jgi:hypothetical protein
MNQILSLIFMLFRGTVLEPIATKLQADLAAGKITVDEGADLVDLAEPLLEVAFPKNVPEFQLGKAIVDAGAKYYDAKKAQSPTPTPVAAKSIPA